MLTQLFFCILSDDLLDNDQIDGTQQTMSIRLPNVRKQLSGLSLKSQSSTQSNGGVNVRLQPVANQQINSKPLNGNKKLAPVLGTLKSRTAAAQNSQTKRNTVTDEQNGENGNGAIKRVPTAKVKHFFFLCSN